MKRLTHGVLLAGLTMSVLSGDAAGQIAQQQTVFGSSGGRSLSDTRPADVGDIVVPELNIAEGTTVEETFALLKTKVPSLQYVISHGYWEHQKLPKMHLQNFTVNAAFTMLRRLFPSTLQIAILTSPDEGGGQQVFAVGSFETQQLMPSNVRVFSLSSAIDRQYNLDGARGLHGPVPEARKRAITEVLSLIENSLKQSDGAVMPVLSIHDETETLIVKADVGYPDRVAEVESILKAIDAPVDQTQLRLLQSQNDSLLRELKQLRNDLDAAKSAQSKSDKK